ncbi:MAG: hypothetical protein U0795_06145 [Pirellulales bacterium]
MITSRSWLVGFVGSFAVVLIAGCSSKVVKLEPPAVTPSSAAAKALELYDADKDGGLTKKELEKAPGLTKAFPRYDLNKDNKIDQQELEQRLQRFMDSQVGLMSYACQVSIGGRPLPDANVRFVPDAFLEGMILPAVGVTDVSGRAEMGIDPATATDPNQVGMGVQFGLYKVEISHPSTKIPDKYGANSEIGVELSPVDRDPPVAVIDIKGR